jgi:hypothetical protein
MARPMLAPAFGQQAAGIGIRIGKFGQSLHYDICKDDERPDWPIE